MGRCNLCSKPIVLPYRCNYCGGYFCDDHRLPFAHKCPNIIQWKSKDHYAHTFESVENSELSKYRDLRHIPVKSIKTKKSDKSKKYINLFFIIFLIIISYYFHSSFLISSMNAESYHEAITPSPTTMIPNPTQFSTPMTPKVKICEDGTIYGSCSKNKPFFCDNGSLIKKPLICGCPEKHIIQDNSCVFQLTLNPEIREFRYCLYGSEGKIPVTLYGGMNEYLSKLSKKVVCEKNRDIKMIENPDQRELIEDLIELIKNNFVYKDEQARVAISLVQKIPYDYKKFYSTQTTYICRDGYLVSGEPPRFPYQVLYDKKGICSEKSRLLALLLKELGFGVVLLEYELENHMAVGIKCPKQYANYLSDDTGYCFIESTAPTIVTDNKGEYIGLERLKSEPKIIFISDGLSFDSVFIEYNDAKEWQRLQEVAKRNNYILSESDYQKWQELVRKYCIEFDQ